MRRRATKRDANHGLVTARFLALGCTVCDLQDTGIAGFPDTLVGCVGANHLVEIKNPESRYGQAGLSATQTAFDRDWRGERVWKVSSPDEAEALVLNWRRNAKGPR